jgi:hypothetical protein
VRADWAMKASWFQLQVVRSAWAQQHTEYPAEMSPLPAESDRSP